jgi:hypothetical protein
MSSLAQVEAVRSGKIDAGYVFFVPKGDKDLETIQVKLNYIVLAAPINHPLTKLKRLRLRDLKDADFLWFPRRVSPALYDQLMQECFRGGIELPRIVQEAVDEATFLSLVSCQIRCRSETSGRGVSHCRALKRSGNSNIASFG